MEDVEGGDGEGGGVVNGGDRPVTESAFSQHSVSGVYVCVCVGGEGRGGEGGGGGGGGFLGVGGGGFYFF